MVSSKSSNVFFCQNFVSLNKRFSKMGKQRNETCVFVCVFSMKHFAWLRTAGHMESRGFWFTLACARVPVRAPAAVPAGDTAPGSAVPAGRSALSNSASVFLGWYPGSSRPWGVSHRAVRLRQRAEVLTRLCVRTGFISR